jgi:hypothetical protein
MDHAFDKQIKYAYIYQFVKLDKLFDSSVTAQS